MYYVPHYRTDSELIPRIEQTLNGEYTAIACYEQLARLAPNEEERNRIMEIRNDELRHFQTFSQIYTSLTGRQPAPQMVNPCPSGYKQGLEFAFLDEQKTVDFYRDNAELAQDPYIKEQFKRAAADEQNHAVWFLYMMSKH